MRRGVVKGVLVALIVLCTTTPADALCLQSWEKKIENPQRFHVLGDFHAAAVLDQETGLVWERDPTFFEPGNVGEVTTVGSWLLAAMACIRKSVGARKGWRLPRSMSWPPWWMGP